MNLERELREALRREPAPADFAARLLAKTGALPGATSRAIKPGGKTLHLGWHFGRRRPWWRRRSTLALAAALVLALLVPTELAEYRRREQQRGIEARDQLITALTITKVQLRHAKEQIRRNTRHTL